MTLALKDIGPWILIWIVLISGIGTYKFRNEAGGNTKENRKSFIGTASIVTVAMILAYVFFTYIKPKIEKYNYNKYNQDGVSREDYTLTEEERRKKMKINTVQK